MNLSNQNPLVSIITVTYNSSSLLKLSLDSLLAQDYPNIESIIIDGESSDDTVEIIKEFENNFTGSVKWISEKDNGIYDGLNKGLKMASGDIIGCFWDIYARNNAISQIVSTIYSGNYDGVHSDLCYIQGEKIIRYWKTGNGSIEKGWMPGHPTLYLKKEIYERYGHYSLNYGIYGDYEFICRCLKDKTVKLAYIPDVLIHMSYGGASNQSVKSYINSILISTKALKDNNYIFPWIITIRRIFHTIKQFRH